MLNVERGGPRRNPQPPARRVGRPHARPDALVVTSLAVIAFLGLLNLDALEQRSLEYHQVVTVLAGVVLFVVMRRLPATALARLGWTCYSLSVVLLAAVLVAGDSTYGARRWLTVGSSTVQPSELAKAGLILVLARVLGSQRSWPRRLSLALILAAVPIGLVVVEPDLSTATVLAVTTVAMLVLGRIPLSAVVGIVVTAAVAAPLAEHFLQPYQAERLHAFLSGSRDVNGAGWTIQQAHIAFAWGGVSGHAPGPLRIVLSEYLPARETDLAFASLVEQWGIRAGALALLAAAALVWRAAVSSRRAPTQAGALSAAGFAVLVATEVSVSVAANLGLLPTAGVPFPLLSYGGTAAVVHIGFAGLLLGQRAEAERHRLWLAPKWRRAQPRFARAVALAVVGGLVAMLGFGLHLQRVRGPELRAAGLTQMTRCVQVPAPRGEITDRHGVPLAANRPHDQVWAVPALMSAGEIRRLAALVAKPVTAIERLLTARGAGLFVPVATLPPAAAARVAAARLPGVRVVPAPRRYYPYGALFGPILGWTGVATADDMRRWPDLRLGATVGRAGLEQMYDPVLRGTEGRQCVYVNPAGTPVAMADDVAPAPGASLRLTIDLGLQRRFTAALAAAMRTGADMGAGVAMDPRDGQVLAMASLPAYNNNVYGPPINDRALARLARRPGNPQLQHATQITAPPGSTFKLAVAAANMTHPVLPPSEVIPTGGSWTLAGHTFHNWSALPPQDLRQAIAWSNDVYFYKLAWSLGADRIVAAARRLGVGGPTGIDLPGEYTGYLGTPSTVGRIGATWYPGSTVLLGIGQGYLTVTPLQDARWTAGVATGSTVTPHLGLAVGSPASGLTPISWPTPDRLPFAGRLGPVRDGMRAAVTSGTAQLLRSLPVPAGGKTGTAEDATAPLSKEDSWLSAVAPMTAPRLEATAFLHGGRGSEPASEPVRAAMAYFFAHERAITGTG
jgi:cell division protein FtsI/penicillin-binding protein 2/cell division protein FtsW (lipid II flippase)